jgi:ribosome-associated toxin RatA of RatAB toxin-antitoxin module
VAHASKSVIVNVTPDQFFSVLVDYLKYPEFLPEVKKTSVEGTPPDALVNYTIDIKAKNISYTVRMKADPGKSLAWAMTKGEMMKENKGSWTLKAVPQGTEATYDIELKLGALVPSFIEKALAETSLPTMLTNFKARAEKLYPKAGV